MSRMTEVLGNFMGCGSNDDLSSESLQCYFGLVGLSRSTGAPTDAG